MRRIYYWLFALIAFAFSGCNSDIFLDEPDMSEYQEITIDGDGGEASFTVSTKNLDHFGFDLMSSNQQYCHYYDDHGEIIDSKSPASEIRRIVFETRFTKIELLRDGSDFTVKSICNTSEYDTKWTIRLEYSYGVRFVEVKVLPGRPIQLVEVVYNDDMITNDRAKVSNFRYGFHNDGPLPQTFTVRPYLNELASILVEPLDYYGAWTLGDSFTMPVPVYVNGEWSFQTKEGIRPGNNYTYEGPNRFTTVDVEVSPYSHVNVFTDVVYTGARVTCQMVFLNEVLDLTFSANFNVTSFYPLGHEIRIEDAQ